jgi:membrane-associated protein
MRSKEFYEKHGGKTIVYAKFIPIIRTFAPFLAGVSEMPYSRFAVYSVSGVVLWVNAVVLLGYSLGGIPIVRQHFEKAIIGVILLSLVPIVIETLKHRSRARAQRAAGS